MESSLIVDAGKSYKMLYKSKKLNSEDQLNHVTDFDHELYWKWSQKVAGSSST